MTEGIKTTSQELLERLQAARGELDELIAEQRRLGYDLEQARQEDHEERMQTARSGGRIASAISALKSRVKGVEDRREALPYEIWSARIRVLELEVEHTGAVVEDLREPTENASREAREADQERQDAERRYRDLTDKASVLLREQIASGNRNHQAALELEALKRSGPE